MKMLFICLLILLSTFKSAFAETQYIKYSGFLVPINDSLTLGSLTVRTGSATNIDENQAVLNGDLLFGSESAEAWFLFTDNADDELVCIAPGDNQTIFVSGGDDFSEQIEGLSVNVNYRFRACARSLSDQEVVAGGIRTFITSDQNTEILTVSPSSVSNGSATLGGQILSGNNVTAWFAVSTSPTLECSVAPRGELFLNRSVGDTYSATVNSVNTAASNGANINLSLSSNTQYFYRACAVNRTTNQLASGSVESFITNLSTGTFRSITFSDRTDRSVRVISGLNGGGRAFKTFYAFRTGNFTVTANDCRNQNSRNLSVLISNPSQVNNFNFTGLFNNTEYSIALCAESESGVFAGVSRTKQFTTKRNENTIVNHLCTSDVLFSSEDGPLNIRVQDPDTFSNRDSAGFMISNFGGNPVTYSIDVTSFGAQTVGDRSVPASSVRTDSVRPTLTTNDDGDQVLVYGVRIFGTQNWAAEFSCRDLNCLTFGNPTGTTADIAFGRCDDISPL